MKIYGKNKLDKLGNQNADNERNQQASPQDNDNYIYLYANKHKEAKWNNRFYLDKIPNYPEHRMPNDLKHRRPEQEPQNQPQMNLVGNKAIIYQQYQQQQHSSIGQYPENAPGVDQNQYKNMSKARRQLYNNLYPQKNSKLYPLTKDLIEDEIQALLSQAQKLWTEFEIPSIHQKMFRQCLTVMNEIRSIDMLKQEIKQLSQKQTVIQKCLDFAENRENVLYQIYLLNQQIKNKENISNDEQVQERCSQLITQLRQVSINLIENITIWRSSFKIILAKVTDEQKIPFQIPFFYKGENYLNKMKYDTNELINSPISQLINIADSNDTFFVNAAKEQHSTAKKKIIQYISKPLMNRIKVCIQLLNEEPAINPSQQQNRQLKSASSNRRSVKNVNLSQKKLPQAQVQDNQDVSLISKQDNDTSLRAINDQLQKNTQLIEIDSNQAIQRQQTNQSQHCSKPESRELCSSSVKQPSVKNSVVLSNSRVMDGIEVKPLRIRVHDLSQFFGEYESKVDKDIKNSINFDFEPVVSDYKQFQELNCLVLRRKNEQLVGLGIICIDKNCFTARRIQILHFSCVQKQHYEICFNQLIQYIWLSDPCNEIRMELMHYEQIINEHKQVSVNKNYESIIKKYNFKWKSVQNEKNGKRSTIFSARRQDDQKSNAKMFQLEPILLDMMVMVGQIKRSHNKEIKFKQYDECYYDTSLVECSAFDLICQQDADFINTLEHSADPNMVNKITILKSLLDQKYSFPEIKRLETDKKENATNFLKENKIQSSKIQEFMNTHIYTSVWKACFKWGSFNNIIVKDFRYLKLNQTEQSQIVVGTKSDEDNAQIPVYLIPTDDEKSQIFIFEISDPVYQQLLFLDLEEQKLSFSSLIKDKINGIDKQEALNGNLALPQFTLDSEDLVNIQYKNYTAGLKFSISTNYQQPIQSLTHELEENDRVIQAPFIFGLINTSMQEMVDQPMFYTLVEEKSQIKI